MAILEVANIRKRFGNTEVLTDISFTLEQGHALAIIGSSGSGKTTLLRCLNFLERPDGGIIRVKGEVLFDANDPATQRESEIRKKRLPFGLVFQSFNLFPQYTVLKNVTLARELLEKEQSKAELNEYNLNKRIKTALKKVSPQRVLLEKERKETDASDQTPIKRTEIEKEALAILDQMGLTDKINSYPHQLSGGQQKRVAIARALAMRPDILCFDEPTSALDPELTGEVLRVIRSLADKKHTMIIVTHEMEFARQVADSILFMDEGLVIEYGSPQDLLDNPSSERMKRFLEHYSR